jgi:replication initiation and membrane attachment protein DnaB
MNKLLTEYKPIQIILSDSRNILGLPITYAAKRYEQNVNDFIINVFMDFNRKDYFGKHRYVIKLMSKISNRIYKENDTKFIGLLQKIYYDTGENYPFLINI